jgi:Uma2 family endonuclease
MLLRSLAPQPATYQDLLDAPAGLMGELIHGALYLLPRPKGRHIAAASRLGGVIGPPFDFGDQGPGGWRILIEPEVHFVRDTEVAVPGLAGWRRERMPELPEDHRFLVVPDWICEVLSPSSEPHDRVTKRALYGQFGVAWYWLLDPRAQTLETLALRDGEWRPAGTFQGDDVVRAEPFSACPFPLRKLFG